MAWVNNLVFAEDEQQTPWKRAIHVDHLEKFKSERGIWSEVSTEDFADFPLEDAELYAVLRDIPSETRDRIIQKKAEALRLAFEETDILAYKDHPKVGETVKLLIERLGIESGEN